MDAKIQATLSLFARNAQALKPEFKRHNSMTKRLAALLYALEGRTADTEAMRRCLEMMKRETRAFSMFRGDMALCLAAQLAMKPGAQRMFEDTKAAYEILRGAKFWQSDYLAVSAWQIASGVPRERFAEVIDRARAFYGEMKARHRFLTGYGGQIFAVMLALSGIDAAQGEESAEQFFTRLKDGFFAAGRFWQLAQILVLGGADDETLRRVDALKSAFKSRKIRMDREFTAPMLGALALTDAPIEALVNEVAEAQAFMRGQKGFGKFAVDTQQLLLYAAGIVASGHAGEASCGLAAATLTAGVIGIIVAQEAAAIAAASSS